MFALEIINKIMTYVEGLMRATSLVAKRGYEKLI